MNLDMAIKSEEAQSETDHIEIEELDLTALGKMSPIPGFRYHGNGEEKKKSIKVVGVKDPVSWEGIYWLDNKDYTKWKNSLKKALEENRDLKNSAVAVFNERLNKLSVQRVISSSASVGEDNDVTGTSSEESSFTNSQRFSLRSRVSVSAHPPPPPGPTPAPF